MLLLHRIPPERFPDVRLRTPANWTVVLFLAALGGVHLAIAIPAAWHGRWEGSLSFFFAFAFLVAAFIVRHWSVEIALLPSRQFIRVRTGTRRWHMEKLIPFAAVSTVRLTLDGLNDHGAQIEIICQNETLECPSTPIPRPTALLFAMMLEVPLVKVSEGSLERAPDNGRNIPIHHETADDESTPI